MPTYLDKGVKEGSSAMTFEDLKDWFNETSAKGRQLYKAKNFDEWVVEFQRFALDYGYVPFNSGSLWLRTDPNTARAQSGYIGQSIKQELINEYGTVPSIRSWSTGSATSGSTTGSLTGGSAKVGQQLIETTVDSSTGEVTTSLVSGTIIGSMTLGDLLLGSALGVGLGVKFVDFFPDQATDFSNFVLQPMINYGIIEPATYETTRIGLSTVLREHMEEGTEKKLITPYAPYELVEKGLQYLLKIGAFDINGETKPIIPVIGNKPIYNKLTDDTFKEISDYFWNKYKGTSGNGYRAIKDDIINAVIDKFKNVMEFKDGYCYTLDYELKFSGAIDSFTFILLEIPILEDAIVSSYDVANSDNNLLHITLNTHPSTFTQYYLYTHPSISPSNIISVIKQETISITENVEFNRTYGSANYPWKAFYHGGVGTVQWLYNGSDAITILCTMQTKTEKQEKIKGLQFTNYTQLIKSVEDITAQLEAWKKKNGFKISTPEYDENGKPIGEREQWYLPLPTPNPSSKTSPDYTLPTGVYEPTNVPDDDPALQDEVVNRNYDYSQELPSNPSYDPTPTPPSDDTGEITTPSSILGNNGSGLWSVYNPTINQLNSFGAWLWSSDIWDQIKQFFSDPMQGIIGLHKIFCKPTNGDSKSIIAGYLDSGVSSLTVTKQYERIDCGTLACAEYYGNALDYSPYTSVSIYLPFIGVVDLNVNEVMGSIIHVFYDIDILTGACLATIEVKDSKNVNVSLYQYNGICSVQIPLTSGNYGSVIASLVTTGAGIVATVASGGALAPVLLGGATSALSSGTNVKQSGTIGSNIGAMAQKKPYLIISRKIPHMALNYNNLEGYPSNNRVYLSELVGYVRCKDVFIASTNANQLEKEMIEEELKNGIFIKG